MLSSFRKIRKHYYLFLIAFLFLFGLWEGWKLWQRRGYKSTAGIYITTGGQSFLVIEAQSFGKLKVTDGLFTTPASYEMYRPPGSPTHFNPVQVSFKNGLLKIKQSIKVRTIKEYYYKEYLTLTLEPSGTIPGDWDLIDAELTIKAGESQSMISPHFWMGVLENVGEPEGIKQNFIQALEQEVSAQYVLKPSDSPLVSFLHKMEDERIPVLYNNLFEDDYSSATLKKVHTLCSEHSNDPYLDIVSIDIEALAPAGNPALALELQSEWDDKYSDHPDKILRCARLLVSRNVSNAQYRDVDLLPFEIENDVLTNKRGFDEKIEIVKGLFYRGNEPYCYEAQPLVPSIRQRTPLKRTNFLEMQIFTKVCRVLASLYLFEGRKYESLVLLGSGYRLGQSLNAAGGLVARLVGINLRNIILSGIETYVLNACETPVDFKETWGVLHHLHNTPNQETGEHIMVGELPLFLGTLSPVKSSEFLDVSEIIIRHKVADMKFHLIRTSTAAKYRYITTGTFPSSYDEFAPLLPVGAPKDVFNDNKPMSFTIRPDNKYVVYSYGPNMKDEGGAFRYDPTNGVVSPGDLIVEIPREREFPFPRQGVRAANAAELLTQFPNGFPSDPFADTRGRPLSILESTKDRPLVIFSFGPDTDEDKFTPLEAKEYKVGDVIITPIPTPPPPPDASPGRMLQLVMGRAESPLDTSRLDKVKNSSDSIGEKKQALQILSRPQRDAPPGHWILEPMYDPTNGICSEGDLYIEISR